MTLAGDEVVIVCSCGEALKINRSDYCEHICAARQPVALAKRWHEWKVGQEVTRAVEDTGRDPAYRHGATPSDPDRFDKVDQTGFLD